MTGRNTTRKSMIAERESTGSGRIEMAAARACVRAVDLLNRALEAARLRQSDLASTLEVSEGRVSQLLNGDGNVRVTTLARALRAAGYQLRLEADPVQEGLPSIGTPKPTTRRRTRQPLQQEQQSGLHVTTSYATTLRGGAVGSEPALVVLKTKPDAILGPILSGMSRQEKTLSLHTSTSKVHA